MQVILRPLAKQALSSPSVCAQFCLTSLERRRQEVSGAAMRLVTFHYSLWSLGGGLACPSLTHHQGTPRGRYGLHGSISDALVSSQHFTILDIKGKLSFQVYLREREK